MASKHKQKNMSRVARKEKTKMQLIDYLGGCCNLCKRSFPPCAYDFHHRNPDNKRFGIAQKITAGAPYAVILEEVKKCVLLCSNCHRIAHVVKDRLFTN